MRYKNLISIKTTRTIKVTLFVLFNLLLPILTALGIIEETDYLAESLHNVCNAIVDLIARPDLDARNTKE